MVVVSPDWAMLPLPETTCPPIGCTPPPPAVTLHPGGTHGRVTRAAISGCLAATDCPAYTRGAQASDSAATIAFRPNTAPRPDFPRRLAFSDTATQVLVTRLQTKR